MTTQRSFIIAGLLGALALLAFHAVNVGATGVTIDEKLSVTPRVISFETVFPGEILFRPMDIALSGSFVESWIHDDVEYAITQYPKPRRDSARERSYCRENPDDLVRCYPSLCPYLSSEPDDTPENDTGVPAFHDPWAPTSVAKGYLAKSDNDTEDAWTVDLHAPCYRDECNQANIVPDEYQLDPALHGETFGCDLEISVTKVSKIQLVTRSQGFWKNRTAFTTNIFQSKLGGTMSVGTGGHVRTVTNLAGNGNSRLFGAWFSSIPKKTNNQNRSNTDKSRMQLLQQLVTAKLNCAAFSCPSAVQNIITSADAAYASGNIGQMNGLKSQLEVYNLFGEGNPIPPALGSIGASTPSQSSAKANKAFWNTP